MREISSMSRPIPIWIHTFRLYNVQIPFSGRNIKSFITRTIYAFTKKKRKIFSDALSDKKDSHAVQGAIFILFSIWDAIDISKWLESVFSNFKNVWAFSLWKRKKFVSCFSLLVAVNIFLFISKRFNFFVVYLSEFRIGFFNKIKNKMWNSGLMIVSIGMRRIDNIGQ